jgi:hypothetical protein
VEQLYGLENMLKWLVTGKDREDTSVRIFDDTLDEVKVEKNDHYNKIYCINRYYPFLFIFYEHK